MTTALKPLRLDDMPWPRIDSRERERIENAHNIALGHLPGRYPDTCRACALHRLELLEAGHNIAKIGHYTGTKASSGCRLCEMVLALESEHLNEANPHEPGSKAEDGCRLCAVYNDGIAV